MIDEVSLKSARELFLRRLYLFLGLWYIRTTYECEKEPIFESILIPLGGIILNFTRN